MSARKESVNDASCALASRAGIHKALTCSFKCLPQATCSITFVLGHRHMPG